MNKTAKQRLSQAEIDSLVQQAATKKQLGSGASLPAFRPLKQVPKPTVDSKRRPEMAALSTAGLARKSGQNEDQNQTSGQIEEQLHTQQPQSITDLKPEESQSPQKIAESPAKPESSRSKEDKQGIAIPLSSSSSPYCQFELKQSFRQEGTLDLPPDMVMAVLNKKLSKLG
ncbi:MAG: hypothetical protein A2Y72_01280 [Chloroflexi bacterium RBG_13_53_26]|jgi:hypothetical protein|nr:MAG: hypothetical protein A2Y72_01280 [Chloroflexi bacterium RBG_13_53_26]